jgi:hypothetical protein
MQRILIGVSPQQIERIIDALAQSGTNDNLALHMKVALLGLQSRRAREHGIDTDAIAIDFSNEELIDDEQTLEKARHMVAVIESENATNH